MKKVSVLVFVTLAFFACKDQLEPESVSQQTAQGEQTTDNQQAVNYEQQETGDTFMKHLSNPDAAIFYIGEQATFSPTVNGTDVNGLNITDYRETTPKNYFAARTDGPSTDGTAFFNVDDGQIGLFSKGYKVGFLGTQYADYGLVQGTTPVEQEPGKYETFAYIGGKESNRIQTPSRPMAFLGTAYVSVMPTNDKYHPGETGGITGRGLHVFETDSLAATYAYGDAADTLRMRFTDWYTVRVIKQHGSNQTQLIFVDYEGEKVDLPETKWGTNWWNSHMENQSFATTIEDGANGLEHFTYTTSATNYFAEFALSAPLFYGENSDTPTGLEEVYCAPRRTKAAVATGSPTEVVISGEYTERYKSGPNKVGLVVHFVFAGKKFR